jgi:hypothetical protein
MLMLKARCWSEPAEALSKRGVGLNVLDLANLFSTYFQQCQFFFLATPSSCFIFLII